MAATAVVGVVAGDVICDVHALNTRSHTHIHYRSKSCCCLRQSLLEVRCVQARRVRVHAFKLEGLPHDSQLRAHTHNSTHTSFLNASFRTEVVLLQTGTQADAGDMSPPERLLVTCQLECV